MGQKKEEDVKGCLGTEGGEGGEGDAVANSIATLSLSPLPPPTSFFVEGYTVRERALYFKSNLLF